jgi:hypothetical protein
MAHFGYPKWDNLGIPIASHLANRTLRECISDFANPGQAQQLSELRNRQSFSDVAARFRIVAAKRAIPQSAGCRDPFVRDPRFLESLHEISECDRQNW